MAYSFKALTPHLARGLDHEFQLALLVVRADQITDHIRGKAALRADGQLIERDELCGFVNPALQPVASFHLRYLRTDEPQHRDLALRHEPQRFERAGARAVVFEQEAVERQLGEQPFRDGIVGSLAMPHTALVAATEMDAERHAGKA